MKYLKKDDLKSLLKHFTSEGLSMRRRFALYIISVISMFSALILILLNLFGILNPTRRQIMDDLDIQLLSCESSIEHDFDKLAAHAISFSEQLEASIEHYFSKQHLTFEELENNPTAIAELQNKLYDIVYLNLQLAPSSGAFYILDTTVNSASSPALYNGIYLKYVNLYSENTVNNEFALYRGSFSTGKHNNIAFHSGWRNESGTDFFNTCADTFTEGIHYALSPVVEIPDTWERARYVYVPIHDFKDDIIGVCGFEVNDLLFQLCHKTEDGKFENVVYGLMEETSNGYTGQFNSNKYNGTKSEDNFLSITTKNGTSILDFKNERCIGKTKELYLGNDTFTIAAMMTQAQYDKLIHTGQINLAAICMIMAFFAFYCSVFMSKKYVSPILRKFEQVKSEEGIGEQLNIREIDDLFTFLEEKDRRYEKQLIALEKAKYLAETEAMETKAAYEKALEKYNLAKDEIDQLAEKNKKEIVLEDYEFFVCNLGTLTTAEYRIYELYLSGKTAKQIAEILNITENTLKYHNKNIYSKLGISSRKQLLRFAALKQHQDKQRTQTPFT